MVLSDIIGVLYNIHSKLKLMMNCFLLQWHEWNYYESPCLCNKVEKKSPTIGNAQTPFPQ